MEKNDNFLNYHVQSGRFAGRSLVACILEDFANWEKFHQKMIQDPHKGKNKLHLALDYLIPKIKNLVPTMDCPICGRRPARYFSIKDCGGFFNPPDFHWVCCTDKNCQHTLECWSGSRLRLLNFSAFHIHSRFGSKKALDPKALQQLLVIAFELPDLSNDDLAIAYLQKKLQRNYHKTA